MHLSAIRNRDEEARRNAASLARGRASSVVQSTLPSKACCRGRRSTQKPPERVADSDLAADKQFWVDYLREGPVPAEVIGNDNAVATVYPIR